MKYVILFIFYSLVNTLTPLDVSLRSNIAFATLNPTRIENGINYPQPSEVNILNLIITILEYWKENIIWAFNDTESLLLIILFFTFMFIPIIFRN